MRGLSGECWCAAICCFQLSSTTLFPGGSCPLFLTQTDTNLTVRESAQKISKTNADLCRDWLVLGWWTLAAITKPRDLYVSVSSLRLEESVNTNRSNHSSLHQKEYLEVRGIKINKRNTDVLIHLSCSRGANASLSSLCQVLSQLILTLGADKLISHSMEQIKWRWCQILFLYNWYSLTIRASEKRKLGFPGCMDSQSRNLIKCHSFHDRAWQQITAWNDVQKIYYCGNLKTASVGQTWITLPNAFFRTLS